MVLLISRLGPVPRRLGNQINGRRLLATSAALFPSWLVRRNRVMTLPGASRRSHWGGMGMTSRFGKAQPAEALRRATRLAMVATAALAAVIAAPDPAGAPRSYAYRAL